jgi:FtsP/CotA-like multicopper oxidase with cupredoxin domain
MTKSRTSLMLVALSVTLIASLSFGLFQESEAAKGQGVGLPKIGSSNSPVCGDRLCSEPALVSSSQKMNTVQTTSQTNECQSNEGTTRTYYIAADEVDWDYAPLGLNQMKGHEFNEDENVFVENTSDRIGSTYIKALYREYTDETFSELKTRTSEWQHLGTLGPIIHAEVCDTIKVVFKNNSDKLDYSVHPHGVFYDKNSEGSEYNDDTSSSEKADGIVAPGQTHTYNWDVPERAGPGPNDPSSIIWMYHSHVDSPMDTNSGLVGPMVVTAKGMADSDGRPIGVDREMVSLFTVSDENSSNYLCDNLEKFTDETCDNEELVGDDDFAESNLMHGINGYVYGNLPGQTVQKDEHVRWYLIGMGTEVDLHTPHWHGNTVLWNGNRVDVMELMPASLKTVDFIPDNVGTWMFHCHVNDHISAGMMSLFKVI